MANIRKALLVREVDGVKYRVYPKTSSDIVVFGDTTVEKALTELANSLLNYATTESVNASIKASCEELYNRIIGITEEDGTTISEAYDTLKEVAAWIDDHGDIVSTFNDSINALNEAIKDIKFKKGTAKSWKDVNPILDNDTLGFEYDTGKYKIGDGVHAWNDLEYQGSNNDDNVEFIDTYNELPEIGIPNTLYCVTGDKLIYHYNSVTSRYEAFGGNGSFDPSIITRINGGNANG